MNTCIPFVYMYMYCQVHITCNYVIVFINKYMYICIYYIIHKMHYIVCVIKTEWNAYLYNYEYSIQ